MRQHNEEIILPYTQEQLYALVTDVEKYPEFVPWCIACRIKERSDKEITADLLIGFKGVSECFTSKVHLLENEVDIEYLKGPFSHLENNWKFEKVEQGTRIKFFIKFQFKSRLLETLIGNLFEKACHKMVLAFTNRAKALYSISDC